MGRTPIVAANWKMYKTVAEARAFVAGLAAMLPAAGPAAVICPPFTALAAVNEALAGTAFALGAQNMHAEAQGAFTGEVAAPMLQDLGVRYVILGHSERRQYFGETDAFIGAKVRAAFAHDLVPILCVGETLAQRDAGQTTSVVEAQVLGGTEGLTASQAAGLIVAYEPIWAIGTGRPSTGADAGAVAAHIRRILAARFGAAGAAAVRVQYGGSVKPANAAEFLQHPEIDGALVGGASLEPASFAAIVEAARR